jgi:hypothetical protein
VSDMLIALSAVSSRVSYLEIDSFRTRGRLLLFIGNVRSHLDHYQIILKSSDGKH